MKQIAPLGQVTGTHDRSVESVVDSQRSTGQETPLPSWPVDAAPWGQRRHSEHREAGSKTNPWAVPWLTRSLLMPEVD